MVGMILATGITMMLNTLFRFVSTKQPLDVDGRSVLVFLLLIVIHFIYKKVGKKAPSPFLMILVSAELGMIFWSDLSA